MVQIIQEITRGLETSIMASTTAIIATATAVASATNKIPEISPWVSYSVDIVLALLFIFLLFYNKLAPDSEEELTPEEMPNELEQVLRTDPEDNQEVGEKQEEKQPAAKPEEENKPKEGKKTED